MINIWKFLTEDRAIDALVSHITSDMERVLARKDYYRWALSGGSTPRLLYQRLAHQDVSSSMSWRRIRIFWGDERCVASDDPLSNYKMARETLLDRVPIPAGNIYPMDGTGDPSQSAERYSTILGEEPLDLILLGMGDDGHTASLFPGTPNLREESRRVIATRGPLPPANRISLSLRTINAARQVVFLVLGEKKAGRLAQVMEQSGHRDAILPAAMVCPEDGVLHWFIDYAAAAQLNVKD